MGKSGQKREGMYGLWPNSARMYAVVRLLVVPGSWPVVLANAAIGGSVGLVSSKCSPNQEHLGGWSCSWCKLAQ